MAQDYASILASTDADVNSYIDDLVKQAQGDTDFIVEQLRRQHELALGTNDQARAAFIESVADAYEKEYGTIAYDYKTATERANEDLAETTRLTTENKNKVLSRLAEDETIWKEQFAQESKEGRQSQAEELSKRGILTGTREGATGLAGSEVSNYEKDLSDKLAAYERELGRTRADTESSAAETIKAAKTTAARTLQDAKTTARRGATESEDTYKYGTESAQRKLEAAKRELERKRSDMLKQSAASSAYLYGSSLNA